MAGEVGEPEVKTTYVTGDPAGLTRLDVNARYMTKPQFNQLVANVKRDGCLTSAPLVWVEPETERKIVLSGNHRVEAAIAAGLEEIGWLEIDEPLDEQRRIALQLSHNSITGQDDPAILKDLFNRLEDIEWREFSGLDDKVLDQLGKVQIESIGEAHLEYRQLTILFAPDELERVRSVIEEAEGLVPTDETWVARLDQFDRLVDAMDTARLAEDVKASALAMEVVLRVFEEHVEDLAASWAGREAEEPKKTRKVPVLSLFGVEIPASTGLKVTRALKKLRDQGRITEAHEALDFWASQTPG